MKRPLKGLRRGPHRIECVVCDGWPPILKPIMRAAITEMPLREPVCNDCLATWWENCVAPRIEH